MLFNYKKKLLSYVFLIFTLPQFVFCQTSGNKLIPGTKVSISPPTDFVASTTFSGFQNVKYGASIIVTEIPAPFEQLANSFTAEALKAKGMTLISKTPIDILGIKLNSGKGVFIEVSQSAAGNLYLKQILMFGDAGKTIMVNGVYPDANKNLATVIKASLLSTSYDESQAIDPLTAVRFSINTEGTPFKFVKFISGSLIYTTDGEMGTKKPAIVIAPLLRKVPFENRKDISQNILKTLPHQQSAIIKNNDAIHVGKYNGFEIVADGKDKDGKSELLYQATLFNNEECYIIVGECSEDYENNLKLFKQVTQTFIIK